MATKPLDQLSPAYRRRIERAMARGKSRQAARGHKAREHVERKALEIERYGLSRAQVLAIENFFLRWNAYGTKVEPDAAEMVEYYREVGYEAFKIYRDTWEPARRLYLREINSGAWESKGLEYLQSLASQAGTPSEQWLYYH